MSQFLWMPWRNVVQLRPDLLSGELSLSMFAADFYAVMVQRQDAASATYADLMHDLPELSNLDPKNLNPDDDFFDALYSPFTIHRVSASRMINSAVDGRGRISEIVVTNY